MLAGVNKVTAKKLTYIAQVLCFFIAILTSKSYALESSIQLHKVDQDKSFGYSLSIGDELFNQKAFNWQVSYNRLENIAVVWNKENFEYSLQTADLSLGYRFYPRSYDKLINSLMVEFQLGVAINLSDHKLIFEDDLISGFQGFELNLAKQGAINPVMSISLQKSLTKNSAMHIGFKHYPSYSDFGSISTLYIGFNYRFGRQIGY